MDGLVLGLTSVRYALFVALMGAAAPAFSAPPPVLPEPSRDPLSVDDTHDPLLEFAQRTSDEDVFAQTIRAAVDRSPRNAVADAAVRVAAAQRFGAVGQLLPSGQVSATAYGVLDRYYSGSNATIIERSRPRSRTDLNFQLDQLVFDWLASPSRLRAASARLAGAREDQTAERDRIALEVIAAWSDVFTYRAVVALIDAAALADSRLRGQIRERIVLGASSEGDLVQIESQNAANDARRARLVRLSDQAEARFAALSGFAAGQDAISRLPRLGPSIISAEFAEQRAELTPAVRSARKLADAARLEARAAKGDALPRVSVGVEGGRYGVFETAGDREIRATVTVRQTLSAAPIAAIRQSIARSDLAQARYDTARSEAVRDARIAFTDLEALARQETALKAAYLAARRARDVVAERFRLRSGTLGDVLRSEEALSNSALAYLQAVTERDAAYYLLLSRTGLLLDALQIPTMDRTFSPDE